MKPLNDLKFPAPKFYTFWVQFARNGKAQTKCYKATNPGQAFAKCHREYPSAQLLKAWRQSEIGEPAITIYEPPSTVSLPVEPRAFEKQQDFRFVEELSFEQRNGPPLRRDDLAA
jgi:hypothetical protein